MYKPEFEQNSSRKSSEPIKLSPFLIVLVLLIQSCNSSSTKEIDNIIPSNTEQIDRQGVQKQTEKCKVISKSYKFDLKDLNNPNIEETEFTTCIPGNRTGQKINNLTGPDALYKAIKYNSDNEIGKNREGIIYFEYNNQRYTFTNFDNHAVLSDGKDKRMLYLKDSKTMYNLAEVTLVRNTGSNSGKDSNINKVILKYKGENIPGKFNNKQVYLESIDGETKEYCTIKGCVKFSPSPYSITISQLKSSSSSSYTNGLTSGYRTIGGDNAARASRLRGKDIFIGIK
jgi:hypothetical protein